MREWVQPLEIEGLWLSTVCYWELRTSCCIGTKNWTGPRGVHMPVAKDLSMAWPEVWPFQSHWTWSFFDQTWAWIYLVQTWAQTEGTLPSSDLSMTFPRSNLSITLIRSSCYDLVQGKNWVLLCRGQISVWPCLGQTLAWPCQGQAAKVKPDSALPRSNLCVTLPKTTYLTLPRSNWSLTLTWPSLKVGLNNAFQCKINRTVAKFVVVLEIMTTIIPCYSCISVWSHTLSYI
jgi:hypothetical protein